jgi:hypothetical protein
MATISKPFLHPITGNEDDPAKSVIKVDYTVTFDSVDLALNQPYRVLARVYGDDTNVSGDGAGGVDDSLVKVWIGNNVIPNNGATQKFTNSFNITDSHLNEDSPTEPQHSTQDDIRVRLVLIPRKPEEVTSEESNLRQVTLVP